MEYIKQIKEMVDLADVLYVQKEVWKFEDIELVPVHVLKDSAGLLSPNGIILGYYIDEKLVAYILTFPTSNCQEVLVEMLAVLPEYQGKGIGFKIFLELRKIMLELNIKKLIWTYDPLESVSANLYVRKLGAIITHHYVNYYGAIDSKTHSGTPTDRFKVEWNIGYEYVINRISGIGDICYSKDVKYVEIPLNFQELKNNNINEAIDLRLKTREIFEEYIEKNNYIGVDFFIEDQKGKYVFEKCI